MRLATAIAMTAVGAVLTVGSCVAYVVVAGWPTITLPLSTGYSAGLFGGGVALMAAPVAVTAKLVRRSRRSPDLVVGPTDGGVGPATTHVIPQVPDTGVRYRAGRVPFPPEPGRPALSVHGLRGGRGRATVAAAAPTPRGSLPSAPGVEAAATRKLPAVRELAPRGQVRLRPAPVRGVTGRAAPKSPGRGVEVRHGPAPNPPQTWTAGPAANGTGPGETTNH